jgi:hypothetical protein
LALARSGKGHLRLAIEADLAPTCQRGKLKNDPGWTVHTLPCTTFIQLEMPDELTKVCKSRPVATSQSLSVWSLLPERAVRPSGDKATEFT